MNKICCPRLCELACWRFGITPKPTHLLRRIIAGPDVEQLLFANCNFDGLVAPEYLLEYVAILLLRGVGHDYPRSLPSPSLTDAIDQTCKRGRGWLTLLLAMWLCFESQIAEGRALIQQRMNDDASAARTTVRLLQSCIRIAQGRTGHFINLEHADLS